jgi:nicotinamide-nucleotide amidase
MQTKEIHLLAQNLGNQCIKNAYKLVIAESCTGGLVCSVITSVSGSSNWFDRGFVTYSNQSKCDLLGVAKKTLANHGAVSQNVANEMALGALQNSHGSLSLSITGIAGPNGGTKDKPVGTVYFAICNQNSMLFESRSNFAGSRLEIQEKALVFALNNLLKVTLKQQI